MAMALLAAGLTGCGGAYHSRIEAVDAHPGISVAEATRLAAQAMQDTGFWPKQQNEAQGTLIGERTQKISMGWETVTLTLEVKLTRTPAGKVVVDAACSPSANIAYWDEGDECVEGFEQAFKRRLAGWQPRVQPPAVPVPTPQPAGGSQQREYDL
jgi:hypothetical protein